ncbi:hypothetical protein JYK02_30115 [Corallococcus macrosporus]|uniref:Probable sensor domain-containing protein n=1 Tax=Corallococcus macrosporus TaxID=35 RepID=A0ABS3DKD0_9BACT|nr:hypothetical protein [Corallococcus macrosporus]MBN8231777.1 hypothetical protein [Corallococcus macrosporus]
MKEPSSEDAREIVEGILELCDELFFASLATEEGEAVRPQIVVAPKGPDGLRKVLDSSLGADTGEDWGPPYAWRVIALSNPQPFTASSIAKLAVAAGGGRSALVVSPGAEELEITGIASRNPTTDGGRVLVITADRPGSLVLSWAARELVRYAQGRITEPPADLFGDKGSVIRDALHASSVSLRAAARPSWLAVQAERVVLGLVRKMSQTRHGGIVAVQREAPSEAQSASVKLVMRNPEILAQAVREYFVAGGKWWTAAFASPETLERRRERDRARTSFDNAKRELDALVEDVGQMTAIDNALLLARDLQVIGAGYHVSSSQRLKVYEATDPAGVIRREYDLQAHGARHHAAAAFADQYPGAVAFIASEDGPLKCFYKVGDQVLFWRLRLPDL